MNIGHNFRITPLGPKNDEYRVKSLKTEAEYKIGTELGRLFKWRESGFLNAAIEDQAGIEYAMQLQVFDQANWRRFIVALSRFGIPNEVIQTLLSDLEKPIDNTEYR